MAPLACSSSQHVDQAAASLDAARSTLCKVVFGLTYDELRVLMRLAMQMGIGVDRHGPIKLEGDALAFVQEARGDIEEAVVYLTSVLVGAGRCA